MKITRYLFTILSLVSFCGSFCLIDLSTTALAEEKRPYKIGSIFSVTGPAGFLGEDMKKTVQMYIEKQNAQGGINGHPIKWYVYDAGSEVTKGVSAAKRLIEQDKVAIVVGDANSSAVAVSLAPIFEKAKVPLLSLSASKLIATPIEEKHWIFKAIGEDTEGVQKCIQWWKYKGFKKAAILTDTSSWGKSAKEEFEIYLKGTGIEVVAWEEFDPLANDLTPQLVNVKAKDPEVIICWTVTPAGVVFLKNVQQLGLANKVIMHGQGFVDKRYMKMAGTASEGLYLVGNPFCVLDDMPQDDPVVINTKKYIKEFKDYYKGEAPNIYGTNGYEGIHLAFEALKVAGDDRAKLRDALENIKGFVGTQKVHSFSPQNHRSTYIESFKIIKWENGDWRFVH